MEIRLIQQVCGFIKAREYRRGKEKVVLVSYLQDRKNPHLRVR